MQNAGFIASSRIRRGSSRVLTTIVAAAQNRPGAVWRPPRAPRFQQPFGRAGSLRKLAVLLVMRAGRESSCSSASGFRPVISGESAGQPVGSDPPPDATTVPPAPGGLDGVVSLSSTGDCSGVAVISPVRGANLARPGVERQHRRRRAVHFE